MRFLIAFFGRPSSLPLILPLLLCTPIAAAAASWHTVVDFNVASSHRRQGMWIECVDHELQLYTTGLLLVKNPLSMALSENRTARLEPALAIGGSSTLPCSPKRTALHERNPTVRRHCAPGSTWHVPVLLQPARRSLCASGGKWTRLSKTKRDQTTIQPQHSLDLVTSTRV